MKICTPVPVCMHTRSINMRVAFRNKFDDGLARQLIQTNDRMWNTVSALYKYAFDVVDTFETMPYARAFTLDNKYVSAIAYAIHTTDNDDNIIRTLSELTPDFVTTKTQPVICEFESDYVATGLSDEISNRLSSISFKIYKHNGVPIIWLTHFGFVFVDNFVSSISEKFSLIQTLSNALVDVLLTLQNTPLYRFSMKDLPRRLLIDPEIENKTIEMVVVHADKVSFNNDEIVHRAIFHKLGELGCIFIHPSKKYVGVKLKSPYMRRGGFVGVVRYVFVAMGISTNDEAKEFCDWIKETTPKTYKTPRIHNILQYCDASGYVVAGVGGMSRRKVYTNERIEELADMPSFSPGIYLVSDGGCSVLDKIDNVLKFYFEHNLLMIEA